MPILCSAFSLLFFNFSLISSHSLSLSHTSTLSAPHHLSISPLPLPPSLPNTLTLSTFYILVFLSICHLSLSFMHNHTHFLLFKIVISLSSPCLLYTGWLRNYVQRKYFENCLRYENSKNYSCFFISNTSFGMVRKYTRCIQRQMTNSRFLTVFR